jgi:stress-induced morphogen
MVGDFMPITKQELETTIKAAFPNAVVESQDLTGDNDHWSVTVKDAGFAGISRIEQHRRVQAAVSSKNIHALQIKTMVLN